VTRISACLVVRDEAERLPACLDALRWADEVVVHDTGSTDATPAIARAAGAVVSEGEWADDFAAARNRALARATGDWVLSVDADEVAVVDLVALQRLLQHPPADDLLVSIDNVGEGATGYTFTTVRLFRRDGARWEGRVHEHVVRDDPAGTPGALPAAVLTLRHTGYADPEKLRRKGRRNARLARAQLDDLVSRGSSPETLAAAALDLGRACVGAGHTQEAVDAFEAVRELVAAGPLRLQATDFLARVLLGAGLADVALHLAGELRAGGADDAYGAWLEAQAQAQQGRPAQALALLEDVRELRDPAGRRYDPAQVEQLRELCRQLLGVLSTAG